MPSRSTIFAPGSYYHVFNRGSEKRTIFQHYRDYSKFLERVNDNSKKFSVDILCFCLMPNHFHFLLRQNGDRGITPFMNAIQLGHAKFFNTKYERVGPLYQGRFKAKMVTTDEYLLHLSAYIHRNPIANLIDSGNPQDSRNLLRDRLRSYEYSSYKEYLGFTSKKLSKTNVVLEYFSKTNSTLSYEAFVENFIPDLEALIPILAHV